MHMSDQSSPFAQHSSNIGVNAAANGEIAAGFSHNRVKQRKEFEAPSGVRVIPATTARGRARSTPDIWFTPETRRQFASNFARAVMLVLRMP